MVHGGAIAGQTGGHVGVHFIGEKCAENYSSTNPFSLMKMELRGAEKQICDDKN